ncbi:hypothetical protein MRX96_035548 [Rhipicephalus microplus]
MPAPLWPVLESNGSHRPCCVPAALLGPLLPLRSRGHVVSADPSHPVSSLTIGRSPLQQAPVLSAFEHQRFVLGIRLLGRASSPTVDGCDSPLSEGNQLASPRRRLRVRPCPTLDERRRRPISRGSGYSRTSRPSLR